MTPTQSAKAKKGALALRMAMIRSIHVYVSVFIAPSLIFFAATGAFQTFRIPDRKDSPVLLQKLARVHRDDVFAVKPAPAPKKPEAKPAGAHEAPAAPKPKAKASTTAVKWFFALVSIAMLVSTVLGLWMALAYHRRKGLLWALLIAGAAIPMVLLSL